MQKIWYKIRYNLIEVHPYYNIKPKILITLIYVLGLVLLTKILVLFNSAF
jgi:hypothetical protein